MALLTTAAIVGVGSSIFGAVDAKKRNKKSNEAQQRKLVAEKAIRAERAVRERRKQVRTARTQQSQIEAQSVGQGSSGANNASAAVSGNLAENLGEINTSLATGEIIQQADTDINNASQQSNASLFNQHVVGPLANQAFSFAASKPKDK